jgi:hypothetical protein
VQAATPDVSLLNIKITGSGPPMPLLDQPGAVPPRPDFLKDIQSSEIVGGQRKLTFSTDNVGGPV